MGLARMMSPNETATPGSKPAGSEVRSENLFSTSSGVDCATRAALLGHCAATVWLTGLSGSGKTTLACAVEKQLAAGGICAFVLDGDNVRLGLNSNLGFSAADRAENIRRVGEVCLLLNQAGIVVLSSFISPCRRDRDRVRALHRDRVFIEVHLATPLPVCEQRDVKGLYARARAGEIADFSGISAPYEAPLSPELRIDTSTQDLAPATDAVVAAVIAKIL